MLILMFLKLGNMKKYIFIIIVLSLLGCASPKLSNLHQGSFKVSKEKLSDLFEMDVNIVPIPEPPPKPKPKPKTFFDLKDSTQVHYLKALSAKVDDPDKLIEYLKKPISKVEPRKASKKTDYTTVKVRFYINHIKQYHMAKLGTSQVPLEQLIHPNSRIAWLNTEIKLVGSDCWQIETIDKVQTLYETIDLGTVGRDQTVNLNVSGSAGYDLGSNSGNEIKGIVGSVLSPQSTNVANVYDENGNLIDSITVVDSSNQSTSNENSSSNSRSRLLGTKAEASYGNQTAIKEAYNLKFNEIKTGYSFDKDEILISQKGSFSRDVSNVELVTATLRYLEDSQRDIYTFTNLFGDNGSNSAKKVEMNYRNIKYIPKPNEDDFVTIQFKYNGLFRAVNNLHRGDNMLEYDDKVIYYPFEGNLDVVNDEKKTISSERYAASIYKIRVKLKGIKDTLTLENAKNNEIVFMNEEDNLYELKNWLETLPEKNIDSLRNNKMWLQLSKNCPKCTKIQLTGPSLSADDLKGIRNIESIAFKEIED